MVPAYKVKYFSTNAVGEPIKFLLSYGGIDFEDIRIEFADWPTLKPTTPFGQLPLLEHKGKVAHQSIAIYRYVAKQVKLVGANDWENLEIDSAVDTITDLRTKIASYFYEKDATVKETLKGPLLKDTVPFYLQKFDDIVKKNNGHFVGGKLTWADVYFVSSLEYFDNMLGQDTIAKQPNLIALKEKVLALPKIKAYLAKRAKYSF